MCNIKKLNRLKRISRKIVSDIEKVDPLFYREQKHVSNTGLTYSDLQDKIDKISSCSSIIELKEDFVQTSDGLEQVLKVSAANFCKQHIICPVCSDRLQARRRSRFNDSIKQQARSVTEGSRYAYMVTYTVTDGESLGERLEHLKEAKKNFRKMGQRRGKKRSGGEAGKIRAAISTIEIKRGDNSKLWHSHSHDLVFTDQPLDFEVYDSKKRAKLREKYGNRIPKEKLSEIAHNRIEFRGEMVPVSKISAEWHAATGGDSLGISVDRIRHVPKNCSGKKKRMYKKMSFEDSVAYQAREVIDYPLDKPWEMNPFDTLEVIEETFNKRMVATYGEFRAVPGDDYADPADPDDNTFVMVWDDKKSGYGEPVPAKLRDIVEDEESHKTRSEAGRALGDYRRQRKSILSKRETFGDSLHIYLDTAKASFKRRVAGIWSVYRQHVTAEERINYRGCDKYSPVMAVAGAFIPGSDSRDIYAAAFT